MSRRLEVVPRKVSFGGYGYVILKGLARAGEEDLGDLGYNRRGVELTIVTLHENGRTSGMILLDLILGSPYCNTIGHRKTTVCGLKEPRRSKSCVRSCVDPPDRGRHDIKITK